MMESLCQDVISYILEFLDDSDHALLKHVSKSLPVRKGTKLKLVNFVSTIPLLQWARNNGCPWNWKTCTFAAGGGHLEVLKWVRANGCPWNTSTCSQTAEGGHLEVLKWL